MPRRTILRRAMLWKRCWYMRACSGPSCSGCRCSASALASPPKSPSEAMDCLHMIQGLFCGHVVLFQCEETGAWWASVHAELRSA